MTKLTLLRTSENKDTDCTFGRLDIEGLFQCVTLERRSVKIPIGTYPIEFTWSPHFNLNLPLLDSVPGRSAIRIHAANYPAQLEGCIAVGTTHNQDSLSNSRFALAQLLPQIVLPAQITVSEDFSPSPTQAA